MNHAYQDIVGVEGLITDEQELEKLSSDLFFWTGTQRAALAVQPKTTEQVALCVQQAARNHQPVRIRGAGMSFSGGYVPNRANTLLVDTRTLNRVREIRTEDRYLTVEAGATWQSVREALHETGLRTVYRPPISGAVSTVGGALSQGSVDGAKGILSLEIVTGKGEVLNTGSAARHTDSSPFFRGFGPDLTGLFLADSGALGIKTAVTLSLEEEPTHVDFLSFNFGRAEDLLASASACAKTGLTSRIIGLDPVKSQNAPKVGFKAALQTLSDVASARAREGGRLQDTWRLAATGRNFMRDAQWSLHVTVEAAAESSAANGVAICRERCETLGNELPNLLPMALHARPFSIRGFLGPQGERWITTNGMFAHTAASNASRHIAEYFDARRNEMAAFGVRESYLLGATAEYSLIEPSFYWFDVVSARQLELLDRASARKFSKLPPQPKAREFAMALRQGLIEIMDQAGATHTQLGRCFGFASQLDPLPLEVLRTIRRHLDPSGILSHGNLELNEDP